MNASKLVLAFALLIGSSKGDWLPDLKSSAINFQTPDAFWWLLDWFIPNSLIEENVFFYSHTRRNYEVPEQLWIDDKVALANSYFDVSKKTVILVHGYNANFTGGSAQITGTEYLTYHNVNVITPDYGNINYDPYYFFFYTVSKSYRIGQFIGRFVVFLIDQGVHPDNIHIVGHSLGAHIAGFAAKYAKKKGKLIGRVTGLEPCYPIYEHNSASYRLASDDAKFTDCIFTTYGTLGMGIPVCQANFFPNGVGGRQPGCNEESLTAGNEFINLYFLATPCGHSLVMHYFIESIKPNSGFSVQMCERVPEQQHPPQCWPTTNVMGEHANSQASGLFYLETNAKSPYSKG